MALSKFEYGWKFLRENNCDGVAADAEDVLCTICGMIMINAHCGRCGCRFCLGCVTQHLQGRANHCPGKTDECREELLDLQSTVHPDNAANQKIARLVVKCPQDRCKFQGELRNMAQHERMCKKKAMFCPYCTVGCQQRPLMSDKIDEHLAGANELHARLLMECVGVLQKENGSIKEDLVKTIAEMAEMRQELQTRVQTQAVEMEALRGQLGELVQQIKMENEETRKSVDEMREKQTKHDEEATRAPERVEKVRRIDRSMLIDSWIPAKKKMRDTSYMDTLTASLFDVNSGSDEVFSSEFSSHENGYKMCLSAQASGKSLVICWHLMEGPFDDALPWPFRGSATVSIVNQVTHRNQFSDTITSEEWPDHAAWQKPDCERNDGYGTLPLVEMEEFFASTDLYKNHQIRVRCVVRVLV